MDTSVPTITIPAGQTAEVGICVEPINGQVPATGTNVSFGIDVQSMSNSTISTAASESFTVPAIDAVTVTADPASVSLTPKAPPVTDKITITNVGNVTENNIALAATTPTGLTITGLSPVPSLAPGQSTTETIMLSTTAPLNSSFSATLTATFGPTSTPQTQNAFLPVLVEVPGASAIASAAAAAGKLNDGALGGRLNDLSTALTNLVQNPTSAVFQSQALASLDSVIGQITNDPFLASSVTALTADRASLAQATTASAVQAAVTQLGTDLGSLSTTLADESQANFTLSLVGNSQVAQPQSPAEFQIELQNTGTQTTTYDLSVSGVPSGVTAAFSQPSITLAPGQVTPGSSGVPGVFLTLTPTSTQLAPFSFTVQAAVEGAPEISRTTTGSLTARSEIVQVIAVNATPPFANPGGQVDITARLLNAVNQQRQAQVSYTVTDSSGHVIFTSQPVTTTLNVLTTLSDVDLGNLDTTGFALGQDTITVTVADASGTPIPGATGTGALLIGTPVNASLSISPTTLPAGSGTVTDTLQVTGNGAKGAFSLAGETSIGSAAGVAVDGNTAYVGTPGGGIDVVDITDPTHPAVLSTFGTTDFPGMVVVAMQVYNNDLVVLTQGQFSHRGQDLLVYSLTSPTSPDLARPDADSGPEPHPPVPHRVQHFQQSCLHIGDLVSDRCRQRDHAAVRRERRYRHQRPGAPRRGERDQQRSLQAQLVGIARRHHQRLADRPGEQ